MNMQQAIQPAKPKIQFNGQVWMCTGRGRWDFGTTPQNAFTMWRLGFLARNLS